MTNYKVRTSTWKVYTHKSTTNDSRMRNEIMQLHNYDESYCGLTEKYLLCRTRTRVGKRSREIYFIYSENKEIY
jgi:hypothetical protein